MRRACGIAVGLGVHALLAVAVWQLFWFLKGTIAAASASADDWAIVDLLLTLQFAVPHSLLLHPPVRSYLTRTVVPGPFYALFFSAATSVSLLIVFAFWRASPVIVWQVPESLRGAMLVAYVTAWVALVYSLNLTGIGWQTGFTPWLAWLQGTKPPRREFQPTGAYRLIRHPVYLSVMTMLWLTPDLTLDHALLASVWTGYIFFGSRLKDRRLAAAIGEPYRRYMAETPGYPGFPAVSLGETPATRPATQAR